MQSVSTPNTEENSTPCLVCEWPCRPSDEFPALCSNRCYLKHNPKQTVNINEFYAANISFNIGDEDLALINATPPHTMEIDEDDEDAEWLASPNNPDNMTIDSIRKSSGELKGYSEVGEGYFGDDRVETESVPLCDTTELSEDFLKVVETRLISVEDEDDTEGFTLSELYDAARKTYKDTGVWVEVDASKLLWKRQEDKTTGRWAHAKDSHCDQREAAISLFKSLDVVNRPFGEMETLAKWRKERFFKMVNFILHCNDEAKLRRMQQEVWKRYIASIQSCAKSKEWFSLYLTKRDVREVSTFITDKRNALLGR